MSDHAGKGSRPSFKSSRTLPFKRKIQLTTSGSFFVIIPKDYVENFGLTKGRKYQFYLEVAR